MSILVDVKKDFGSFALNVRIESSSRRVGVLGASGSGKSMTLRCIAGIERPDSGIVELNGRTLFRSSSARDKGRIDLKPQQRRVGYMFQNYALFPTMTVRDNIAAGVRGDSRARRSAADEMICRFGLEGLEKRLPGELSGGQQQRVALARIMAYEPDVIMLDEPFAALDVYLRDRLQHELQGLLADYAGQVIMVSHSRDEIYRFSDEVFVLDGGEVLASGETGRLFAAPGRIEVAKITGCKNFSNAVVVDEHRVEATDWGITLTLSKRIPPDIKYVGYRAHYFEPVWGERLDNCISFRPVGIDELPFERRYYIEPEESLPNTGGENCAEPISWFVQQRDRKLLDRKGLPDYLMMREDDILLLR